MAKFQEKLYKFMYGRYGTDRLNRVLSVVSLIVLGISLPVSWIWGRTLAGMIISFALYALSLGLCIFATYRAFSRKIYKRQAENNKWCAFEYKVRCLFRRHNGNKDTDTHVFRDCPKCKSTLRLPREQGKHTVRCPQCANKFTVRIRAAKKRS